MKGDWDDDEISTIGDKGDLGFVDYDHDKSVCTYDPSSEGPIVISIPFPFVNKKPQSVLLGDIVFDKITITNTTNEPLDLWKVDIYDSTPKDSFTLSLMEPPKENSEEGFFESFCLEDRVLQPEQMLNIWLNCKPKGTGLHTSAVHFEVGDNVIERLVFIMVDDKISRALVSNKPYERDRKKKQLVVDKSDIDTYVPTRRPVKDTNRGRYRYHLNSFPIPKEVREVVNGNLIPNVISEGLLKENYCNFFSTLLNIEEIILEEEMRGYDMECVSFGRKGRFLTLEVPGLAEKRPSLVFGDFIFAKLASDDVYDTTPPYQGYIHRVEAEEVHLQFEKDFHSCHFPSNLYNVQFNYNRANMRKLYQAIKATDQLETDFLFPSDSPYKRRIKPTQMEPFSDMLNEEQQNSIKMIIGCRGGPPYIIHGPPGTGKTVTIVEAVVQLYRKKGTKLLVCAPSNSAADNILEILLEKLGETENIYDILRLNAVSRPLEDIKPEYLRFCYFEESCFTCPAFRELSRFRIIISTYMSSFSLYAEGLKLGHFSHIFLDEAGQASEPETMVPLSHLCTRGTVVVLAGDPCQLGPVIHSKDAENSGLSVSFLARLFDYEFYNNGNENYVTKLVRNYRCHKEILFLPSQLFYGEELIAMRNEDSSATKWADLLPNKEFPLLFMGIQGCDEREGNNPSWFNRIEASKVVEIVRKLIEEKGLNGEDIGVITPYRQQVIKISNILESLGCSGIKVGSVEQFQGQERKVIIVSTVRSTIKHNEFDKIHYLGFLSNSRRFNVAITRARDLLIIIGNPHIIGKDKYWNLLLWRCEENKSYQGCPLPERESFVEELPPQEDGQWGYEGQENYENNDIQWNNFPNKNNDTEWDNLPKENNDTEWDNLPKENNDTEWDNVPNESNIPQSSNDDGWGNFPKENPKTTYEFDDGIPWE